MRAPRDHGSPRRSGRARRCGTHRTVPAPRRAVALRRLVDRTSYPVGGNQACTFVRGQAARRRNHDVIELGPKLSCMWSPGGAARTRVRVERPRDDRVGAHDPPGPPERPQRFQPGSRCQAGRLEESLPRQPSTGTDSRVTTVAASQNGQRSVRCSAPIDINAPQDSHPSSRVSDLLMGGSFAAIRNSADRSPCFGRFGPDQQCLSRTIPSPARSAPGRSPEATSACRSRPRPSS
jgi:hypothetical protein